LIGHPLRVEDLISNVKTGEIGIPEIQRGYVWRRTQIARLLDSMYRGFPAGQILLWDTTLAVEMRALKADLAPSSKPDFRPKIVLDGQQRLTSLAKVLNPESAKNERILFNVLSGTFEPYSPRNGSDPRWIDTTEILTGQVSELDVLDRLEELGVVGHGDRPARNEIHERLNRLRSIRRYEFPIEIVKEDDLETVTEIFIRANSAGTRLREAELALAKLAWKLPGRIVGAFEALQEACVERGFDIDTRFLMRALIVVATRQSRFRDLKALWGRPPAQIDSDWRRVERWLRRALDFVEGNVGIPGSGLLASQFTLFPLIATFADREQLTGDEQWALRAWFLRANAFSHYVGSPETTLDQDIRAMGERSENVMGLLDKYHQDSRGNDQVTANDLARAGINSPFFPLAFLAVIAREAADWFTGIKIRRSNFSEDQNIEYHHIFPKKLLNTRGVDRYVRDEIANIAFLGQRANKRILAREPSDYLAEIAEQDRVRLESQFVPMDQTLWHMDRFETFLAARRELLAHEMNQVLGR
jgi:hypothetical protein